MKTLRTVVSRLSGPVLCLLFTATAFAETPGISFNYETQYFVGGKTKAVLTKTADLNRDHIIDLVSGSDQGLSVMLGKGDGTFREPVTIAFGGQSVADFAIADLNRDGKADIVAVTYGGVTDAYVLLGDGDGTFKKPTDLQINNAYNISLGDLDGDGKLDLIADAIFPNWAGVRVYIGKGDGTFNAQRPTVVLPDLPNSHVGLADFNGDGHLDVVLNSRYGVVYILLGKGFGDFQPLVALNVGRNSLNADFIVADLNGDEKQDLAIPLRGTPGAIKILLGNGDGTFQSARFIPLVSPSGDSKVTTDAWTMAVADFNIDGIPDVVATPEYLDKVGGDLNIFLGKGDGSFGEPIRFTPTIIQGNRLGSQVYPQAYSSAVADFNGDGLPDIAIGNQLDGMLYILVNGVQPPPVIPHVTNVVNGAGFIHGSVAAPGELVSIFGVKIGPTATATAIVSDGLIAETNSGVTVLFDDLAAPLLSLSETQINAIVPFEVAHKQTTDVRVQYNGTTTPPFRLSVLPAAPGIFTQDGSGRGQAICINEDGTPNSADNPAAPGSIITIFATGTGVTTPESIDGQITSGVRQNLVQHVTVALNSEVAEVQFAGAAPGAAAGITQLNIRIPLDRPNGPTTPISFQTGTRYSQPGVTVAVK